MLLEENQITSHEFLKNGHQLTAGETKEGTEIPDEE